MKRLQMYLLGALLACCAVGKADIRPPVPRIDFRDSGSGGCSQVVAGLLLSAGLALGGKWAWKRLHTNLQSKRPQ